VQAGASGGNPITTVSFFIPAETHVIITVYDVLGKKIETLANRQYLAGEHKVTWNANGLPNGLYFLGFQAGEFRANRKMNLF
jgi:hypothetical protein